MTARSDRSVNVVAFSIGFTLLNGVRLLNSAGSTCDFALSCA